MNIKDLVLTPEYPSAAGDLDKAIRAVVKDGFLGISTYGDRPEVSVWIDTDIISSEDVSKIEELFKTFDPKTLPVEPPIIEKEDILFKSDLKDALEKLASLSLTNETEIKEAFKQLLVLIYKDR